MFDNHGHKNIVTYLSGVTITDHKTWKIAENQAFSAIFIFAQPAKIGISEHSTV